MWYLNDTDNQVNLYSTQINLPLTGENQARPSLLYCRFEHIVKESSFITLQDAYKDDVGNYYDSDFQRVVFSGNQVTGTLEYLQSEIMGFCAVPEAAQNGLVPTKIIFDGRIKLKRGVGAIAWTFLDKSIVTGLFVDAYGLFYTKDKKEVKLKVHNKLTPTLIIRKKIFPTLKS